MHGNAIQYLCSMVVKNMLHSGIPQICILEYLNISLAFPREKNSNIYFKVAWATTWSILVSISSFDITQSIKLMRINMNFSLKQINLVNKLMW